MVEIADEVESARRGWVAGMYSGPLVLAAVATMVGATVAAMAGLRFARELWPVPTLAGLVAGAAAAGAFGHHPGVAAADRAERRLRGTAGALAGGLTGFVLPTTGSDHPLAVGWINVVVAAVGAGLALRALGATRSRIDRRRAETAAPGGRPLQAPPLPPLCRLVKRMTDVVGAIVALGLCAPMMAIAAVAIAMESPGGWLFRQTRLGRNGRPFTLYKLRTMYVGNDDDEHLAYAAELVKGNAERKGGLYKLTHDPRRTRIGGLLRRTSIDELPQLVNVLRGDMSLVGPRPTAAVEAHLWDQATWQRIAVKPGITGLWQVSGRSKLGFDEMVALDIEYWQRWTPLLDLRILVRTPRAVLTGNTA